MSDRAHSEQPNEDGEVVPFQNNRKTYQDALVEQMTARAIAESNRRLEAIIGSNEAKGRRDLAMHLAFATDLPPEQALGVLRAANVQPEPDDKLERMFKGKDRQGRAGCKIEMKEGP